jgi:tetratricopeptide (TPR) repeat protein
MQPPPPKPQPKAQSPQPARSAAQEGYAKEMQAGAALDKQRKYVEAIAAYKEALRLVPGDGKASAALHMATGQKALGDKHFTEAASEFEQVLKLVPKDPAATQGLQQAKKGRP